MYALNCEVFVHHSSISCTVFVFFADFSISFLPGVFPLTLSSPAFLLFPLKFHHGPIQHAQHAIHQNKVSLKNQPFEQKLRKSNYYQILHLDHIQ